MIRCFCCHQQFESALAFNQHQCSKPLDEMSLPELAALLLRYIDRRKDQE